MMSGWNNSGGGGVGWGSGDARVQEANEFAQGAGGFEGNNEYVSVGEDAGGYAGNDNAGGGGGSGGCFKCGQEGHMKDECPNEAIPRQFTGTCRSCGEQGHRASDCPAAPPKLCLNCLTEGHDVVACESARNIDRSKVEDITGEAAWAELKEAVDDRELADVKAAFEKYVKVNPETTYVEFEKALRSQNVGVYLIALEKELAPTYVNMDLQGNLKKTYSITWRFSPKPLKPKDKESWPETSEENLTRLEDAGDPVDCLMPKCSNCDELGHTKKFCTQDPNENADRAMVKCFNCDGLNHRVRDCPNARPDKFACRNCKQSGHDSKSCPEPRSAEGVECKECNEVGHFSRDCPTKPQIPCFNCGQVGHRKNECQNEKVSICRNCDGIGHMSRECNKPTDWSRVTCSNCKEKGHTKVKCPLPAIEDTENGNGGAPTYGGESGNAGYGGAGDVKFSGGTPAFNSGAPEQVGW